MLDFSVRLVAPALKSSANARFPGGGCGSVGVDVWVDKESPQPPETSTNARFWGCGVVGRQGEPPIAENEHARSISVVMGVSLVAAARETQRAFALVFGGCERLWGLLVGAANEAYNRQNECKTLDFGGGIWRLAAAAAREIENKLDSSSWKGG